MDGYTEINKWNGLPNFGCDADNCKFATIDEGAMQTHVHKHGALVAAVVLADAPDAPALDDVPDPSPHTHSVEETSIPESLNEEPPDKNEETG